MYSVALADDETHPRMLDFPSAFAQPFDLNASAGGLWITPHANPAMRTKFHIKGANWAGFQADGCVHALWRYSVDDYIAFLVTHRFNAVRLPLSGALVNDDANVTHWSCGSYTRRGWNGLRILDDVVEKLVSAPSCEPRNTRTRVKIHMLRAA